MKKSLSICILITCVFLLSVKSVKSQDYILLKNKSVQKGQVIEVTTDKVRYKKNEIPNGPTYDILKSDVMKITYSNGYTDIFDTTSTINHGKSIDTATSSIIYIVFNSGQDESQEFPLYFNGQYICNFKNHTRMQYLMHSTGLLVVERRGRNAYKNGPNYKIGPTTEIFVNHGVNYGINIQEPYPQALDPNKRFSIETYINKLSVQDFLDKKFYGFKPFKDKDLKFKENIKNPVSNR